MAVHNQKAKPGAPKLPAEHTEAVARIGARYDALPYVSHAYPQSHPARIGAVAHLMGLETVPLARARVLEIGCASGGNLIPIAAMHPDAAFTGIDLSAAQVESAEVRIKRLGLTNVTFLNRDIAECALEPASFDYVICHGVYSWAPPRVRKAILATIERVLSPLGVGHVSYNVLPGWRQKQVLRDALMWRLKGVADPKMQVGYTRAFVRAINEWKGPDSAYHRALRELAAHVEGIRDDYLAHEFLEIDNSPQTFVEFAEEIGAAGLTFVGECETWMQIADNFDAPTRDLLRNLSGGDVIAMEQAVDVLTGRTFRQTIVARAERGASIVRMIPAERLLALHLIGPLVEKPERPEPFRWEFSGPTGKSIMTNSLPALRALRAFAAKGPASASVRELLLAAAQDGGEPGETERASALDALQKAVLVGVADARMEPVIAAAAVSEHPMVPAIMRSDAEAGADLTTLRHDNAPLDIVARLLVPKLDGAHDRAMLYAHLVKCAREGQLTFSRGDVAVTDDEGLAACAAEHVGRTLAQLRDRACLAG